jgi:hypothetical protein
MASLFLHRIRGGIKKLTNVLSLPTNLDSRKICGGLSRLIDWLVALGVLGWARHGSPLILSSEVY